MRRNGSVIQESDAICTAKPGGLLLHRGVSCYTGEFIAKLGGSLTARTLIGRYNNAFKAFSLRYTGQQSTPL